MLQELSCTHVLSRVRSHSISLTIKHCKLSLLANITQSSDPIIQGLALQLDFGFGMLQINNNHHEILTQPRNQLSTIPSAKKLYLTSKKITTAKEKRFYICTDKLESLSVQCKFKDAASLEQGMHIFYSL